MADAVNDGNDPALESWVESANEAACDADETVLDALCGVPA